MFLKSNFAKLAFLFGDVMNKKPRLTLLLLAFSALGTLQACLHHYGTKVESFPPAHSPNGVIGEVVTTRTNYKGEVIEVRDTGIVILAAGTFRFVSYSAIISSHFDGIGGPISSKKIPSSQSRERLRLVSRFPQELTPEILQKLLSANAQTELAQENP
jgi:hypothetical protein